MKKLLKKSCCIIIALSLIMSVPVYSFADTELTSTRGVEMSAMASKISKPKISLKYVDDYSNIKISWKKCSGAQKYWIYRAENGGSYRRIKTTSKTYFTDLSVQYNKKYSYKVRAISKNGKKSSYSNIKSGIIEADGPTTYDDFFGVPNFGVWFSVDPYDVFYGKHGTTYYYWGADILDSGFDFDEILPYYEGWLNLYGFDYLDSSYNAEFDTIDHYYTRGYDNVGVVVSFTLEGIEIFIID
jgi:hypothetical protein